MLCISNLSMSQRLAACAAAGMLSVVVAASNASATTVDVATVLDGGTTTYNNIPQQSSATAEINYIAFIQNSANPATVQYDNAGNTANVAPNIYAAGAARGPGQGIEVDGYGDSSESGNSSPPDPSNYLYLSGQSEVNHSGFGAHANWVVTVNLDAIRANELGGSTATLNLSGLFGAWGSIGDKSGGVIQGEIWLDGTRIDSMGLTSSTSNQSFNLSIPSSGHELSFFILNSPTSSLWDDGIFENTTLSTPEPASLALFAGVATMSLARRRKVS